MNYITKQFETVHGGRTFTVEYYLYADGHTQLNYINCGDLPIDIAELFGSSLPAQEELYEHILSAMTNNASESVKKSTPISDHLSNLLLILIFILSAAYIVTVIIPVRREQKEKDNKDDDIRIFL